MPDKWNEIKLNLLEINEKKGYCAKRYQLHTDNQIRKFDMQKEFMKEYIDKLDFFPKLLAWERQGSTAQVAYKFIPNAMQASHYFGTEYKHPIINTSVSQVVEYYFWAFNFVPYMIYTVGAPYIKEMYKDKGSTNPHQGMMYMGLNDYFDERALIDKKGKLWVVGLDALRINRDPFAYLQSPPYGRVSKMLARVHQKLKEMEYDIDYKEKLDRMSFRAENAEKEYKIIESKIKNTINKDVIKNTIGEQQYEFYFNSQ